jgi:hypothetical protein
MPSLFGTYLPDSACVYHRLWCPLHFCAEAFAAHGWDFTIGEGLPTGHDVVMLHGLPVPTSLAEFGRVKYRGAKFVWSLDDDWKTIPAWNPANPGETGMATYTVMKELADVILTSTPHLASTFSDVAHKVVCAPNLLDLTKFPDPPKVELENGQRVIRVTPKPPIRVVWAGGPTHVGDMEPMTGVLDEFLTDFCHTGKAVVIYFGASPHPRLIRKHLGRGLFHQPGVTFTNYQKMLNSIDPHVYLAPLAEIPFNESKSNLRLMESWALCAAPIATDWGEYSCVANGIDGRLVTTPDQWRSALKRLVEDHEYRVSMAASGRSRAEICYDWNNPQCREPWNRVFERLTGVTL